MHDLTSSLRRTGRIELGLRALIALEGATQTEPYKLPEVVERVQGSTKFIAMILGTLCKQGIASSSRGARGGYWLARSLAEITVLQVVEALGPGPALDSRFDTGGGDAISDLWNAIDDELRTLLCGVSIADLTELTMVRCTNHEGRVCPGVPLGRRPPARRAAPIP